MTDIQPPQTPAPPPCSENRDYYGTIMPILFLTFWSGHVWPDRVPILVGIGPPLFLIILRAWKRRVHPEQVPSRWPKRSRLQARLETLDRILMLLLLISLGVLVYIDITKRTNFVHNLCLLFFCTGQAWNVFLTRYIEDRKPLLPPPPEPKGGWSGTIKGIHSDHWGILR
jgi:hypothetical protein